MSIFEKFLNSSAVLIYIILIASLVRAKKKITVEDIAPEDYDYLHAPQSSSEPLNVNVSVSKINIRSIDESDMSFSVTLEMYQSWIDFRLQYPEWATPGASILDSGWIHKIWNPKLYFRNAVDGKLDNIISPSSFFWLKQDGSVIYCCRVILKLICEMDLKYFPHDKQECVIQMSSSVYSTREILLRWWSISRTPDLFTLQQFDVKDVILREYNATWGPQTNLSSLELAVLMNRRTGFYLINVYIPTILIVIMSMLTFWIPPDAVPARVTLGVTSLLTIITKQYQAALPNVSYIVALNVWLSSCIAFVFFSLLEFAAVIALNSRNKQLTKVHNPHPTDLMLPLVMLKSNGTWSMKDKWVPKKSRKEKEPQESKIPKRLDYFSRVFFPFSFIVFSIIYWKIYD